MSQNLNPVRPKVRLDGEEIPFESLTLEQSVNSCHHFDVVRDFMSQDEMWKESPQKLMSYVGARALIRFEQQGSGESYEFSGYVTDVRIDAWESEPDYDYYNHRSNRVHFIGEGDVMRLNGALGMDSFTDSTLKNIVSEVVSPSGLQVECQPHFDGIVPYVMRYKESVFGFLNRLSSTYNELFFYDGKKLWFGKPGNCGEETLVFEQDVFSLRTHASVLPHKVSAFEYFMEQDTTDRVNASQSSLSGVLKEVSKASDRLYEEEENIVSGSPLTDKGCLMTYADNKQHALEGGMFNVEGETRTCRIKLGCVVEINFPSKMQVSSMGRFRIVSIVHKVNKAGNYSNHFIATPDGHEYVTQQYLDRVKAYPEVATVSSNSDPKSLGRVQVQFDWQKRLSKSTNWIRVQSPDAGGSGMTNRGLVFIPEEGDQVMVGFEYGDPSRPYVMGSLFTGANGAGGGDGNNIHSIVTKTGHKIEFNDEKGESWGITIVDGNGNSIRFAAQQNEITVSAGETINLSAKNIHLLGDNISLDASDAVTICSGKDVTVNADESMNMMSGEDVSMMGKNISMDASESTKCHSDELKLLADSEIEMNSKKIGVDSTKENLVLASGGDIDAQSKGKINLF
ncbi:MAG: phage baseplate assembly protein V [Bacteroidales bacterium]|nr:phage baseplate assembly protein V [Bacteroidales bacterium]